MNCGSCNELTVPEPGRDTNWSPLRAAGAALAVAGVGSYPLVVGIGPAELVRLLGGISLLWGPLAVGLAVALRREIPDGSTRCIVAVGGSYALTTATYFLWAIVGFTPGFYGTQVLVLLVAAWRVRRDHEGKESPARFRPRINWLLVGLIAIALHSMVPYTRILDVSADGSRHLHIPSDGLYYAGQTYELSRNVPPRQDSNRAGTPPRSYHLFSHLTTLLLARTSGQTDLLRAQAVYHLGIITVIISSILYCLGRALTRTPAGGYSLIALLYPLAIVSPPLLGETTDQRTVFTQFYFTIWPQLSSMIEPNLLGSWQTYSAILVLLTLVLVVGLAAIRQTRDQPSLRLWLLSAFLVASLSRFRVQGFLVALPAFLLVMALSWYQHRDRRLLIVGALSILASVPLLLEATSSIYRPGSNSMGIGFNGITSRADDPTTLIFPSYFLSAWPFSRAVRDLLSKLLSDAAFDWTWQAICLTAFLLLNMIGIPLLAATGYFLARRRGHRETLLLEVLLLSMALGCLLIAILVKSGYDSYSLSAQALYLPPWFLFPLISLSVVALARRAKGALGLTRNGLMALGLGAVALGFVMQQVGRPSRLVQFETERHVELGDAIDADLWLALRHLHDATPIDAVVISNEYTQSRIFFSGIGGRAGYLEGDGDINNLEAIQLYGDNRATLLEELWSTESPERFCTLLSRTPATHLVEFSRSPFFAENPGCLKADWRSPERKITIWSVTA